MTAVIDALEEHEVVVFDALGIFKKAKMDELVHVQLTR